MGTSRGLLLLAAGYWRRRFGRGGLMLAGITLGVALLGAVLLVNDALLRTYAGWAHGVFGWTEVEVRAVSESGMEERWVEEIAAVPGVAVAAPVLERRTYVFKDEAQVAVTVRGVEPDPESQVRPRSMVAGRALEPGDRDVTILSYAAALALDAAPGTDVELLTPEGVDVLRVVGVYRPADAGQATAERAALTTLPQAQATFAAGRALVTRVDVAVAEAAGVDELRATLARLLGDEAHVRHGSHAATELARASSGLRTLLLLAGLLAVMASALLIATNVMAMVEERDADLELLHALGVARSRLRRWLAVEVGFLVAAGAGLGLPLAAPAARLLISYLPDAQLAPYAVQLAAPRLGATALLGGGGVALPAAALVTLLTVALFRPLLGRLGRGLNRRAGLPLWLRLAAAALERRRGSAAVTAAALLLTLAGVVGIFGVADSSRHSLAAWLDASVTWDLRVAAGPDAASDAARLPGSTVARVAALPGVAAVAAERRVTVASRGHGLTVIALDGRAASSGGGRLRVVQAADVSGSELPQLSGGGVALSVPLAARLALRVGDTLPLTTLSGESHYTVVALVDDSASRVEAAYLDLGSYAAAWGDTSVDSITVRLTPGAEAAAVARTVSASHGRAGAKVPLHVTLADGYRSELLAGVAAAYRGVRMVVSIAVAIALIGLLHGAMAAGWRLRRELSLLGVLGAPRGILTRAVTAQIALGAGLATGAGALLGTVSSLALSRLMAGAAAPLAWYWPVDAYLAVALLLATTGAVAAILVTPPPGVSLPRSPRR